MDSKQGQQTEKIHLQPNMDNLMNDLENIRSIVLSADPSFITFLLKDCVKKCVIEENTVVGPNTIYIPPNQPFKIGNYKGVDSISIRNVVQKSVDEEAGKVFTNDFILTQCGGETKNGEDKNDNARNDEKKDEGNQNAGGGGLSGVSGFMSVSTSGSSSGGDGGDEKGGNDDRNKTPRDLVVEADTGEEDANKKEEEKGETEEEIEKKKQTQSAENTGQAEDDDAYCPEKTGHSTDTHHQQDLHRLFGNLMLQQSKGNFTLWANLLSSVNKILLLSPFGQHLCRSLHHSPWSSLTESDRVIQPDLLPLIREKQENTNIVSASAHQLTAQVADVLRFWIGRNQKCAIGHRHPADMKLQTSNNVGSQMQKEHPEKLLTEDVLCRGNSGPGCQRFQIVIFTVCIFHGHNRICSSVIITDPGLSPDPRNMVWPWPHDHQNVLKGLLYWISYSFQRFMASRALEQRRGLLQNSAMHISQTRSCMLTMLGSSQYPAPLGRRALTVSVTPLPTGCRVPCPGSSITDILSVIQHVRVQQKNLIIQANTSYDLSEISQSILSFETAVLGEELRNMQRSTLHEANQPVHFIQHRTSAFLETWRMPMADSNGSPCQRPQQNQKRMQRETAHQTRQTQPMSVTGGRPRLQQPKPRMRATLFKAPSKVALQPQIMTHSSAKISQPSIRRTHEGKRTGALCQPGRSYIHVDHPCLEQYAMLRQVQSILLQLHLAKTLKKEPLPLAYFNPNDSGVHHSAQSMGDPVSPMDSGVGQRTNQHPKGQHVRYSGKARRNNPSPEPSMAPVRYPYRSFPEQRGRSRSPVKADPQFPWPIQAHTGTTNTTGQHRASTLHPDFRSASGSNVSPTRGYPGPPTPSSQDRLGNRNRSDYRTAQKFLASSFERVAGPPNRSSGFAFSSPFKGLQSNSLHAEVHPNTNPGPGGGMQSFQFEPGDRTEQEDGAQGFSQAQYRPQRGRKRQHPVFPQCSEDLTFPRNSSSDHDINRHRPETTVGPRNTPQQQHLTNQRELPFPTLCEDDVHRWGSSDTANPSATSNHGEVPHENTALPHGGPVQQGPPAPNNYDRCQVQLRECTVVAHPAHMTEAELERRYYDLIAENRRLRQAFMCQICLHQPFTCVFDPCGHKACDYCSSILCECCICKVWIDSTIPASFR